MSLQHHDRLVNICRVNFRELASSGEVVGRAVSAKRGGLALAGRNGGRVHGHVPLRVFAGNEFPTKQVVFEVSVPKSVAAATGLLSLLQRHGLSQLEVLPGEVPDVVEVSFEPVQPDEGQKPVDDNGRGQTRDYVHHYLLVQVEVVGALGGQPALRARPSGQEQHVDVRRVLARVQQDGSDDGQHDQVDVVDHNEVGEDVLGNRLARFHEPGNGVPQPMAQRLLVHQSQLEGQRHGRLG